jgi:hypothetical protein
MIKGSAALAATGLAAAGLARTATAQDATPVAEGGASDDISLLFVQSFQGGTIAPKEGVDGRYTLSLTSGVGQTIYFSDRPDRVVGASPTPEILSALGFPDDNPPNAALVFEAAPGDTDVAVVELFSPVYDEATGGLTYEVEVLQNWQAELEMGFGEAPRDLATIAPNFGTAHLFIDSATAGIWDCPDSDMTCYAPDPNAPGGKSAKGTIPNADHDGYCVQRPALYCGPCKFPAAGGGWGDECNRRFPECNGQCQATPLCTGPYC